MYKKYVAMGIVGGLGFLLVFLIGRNFLVALIIGLLLMLLTFFFFPAPTPEPKLNMNFDSKRQYGELLERGKEQLRVFEQLKSKLGADPLSKEIDVVVDYCNKIFNSIEKTPGNHKILGEVVEVYLPSIYKIIDRYLEVKRNDLQGKDAKTYMTKAQKFMQELSGAFSRMLNDVHDDDILEATVEMETMKLMMQGSGYIELYDFDMDLKEDK